MREDLEESLLDLKLALIDLDAPGVEVVAFEVKSLIREIWRRLSDDVAGD